MSKIMFMQKIFWDAPPSPLTELEEDKHCAASV